MLLYKAWDVVKPDSFKTLSLTHSRRICGGLVMKQHGTTDWFQIGKGVCQDCILSPCLFNLHVEYIMRNARLDETQAGIKTAGRNINNLRYSDDTTLMAESDEELKSFLMKVKEESEKVALKLNIQKTKIMAFSPIKVKWSRLVVSVSLRPHGLQSTRLSAHGIFQATVLEWVAISFSRGSSRPRDWIRVSHIVGRRVYHLSHQGSITSWQIDEETMETVRGFIFLGAPKSLQMVTAAMKLKDAYFLEEKLWPT